MAMTTEAGWHHYHVRSSVRRAIEGKNIQETGEERPIRTFREEFGVSGYVGCYKALCPVQHKLLIVGASISPSVPGGSVCKARRFFQFDTRKGARCRVSTTRSLPT